MTSLSASPRDGATFTWTRGLHTKCRSEGRGLVSGCYRAGAPAPGRSELLSAAASAQEPGEKLADSPTAAHGVGRTRCQGSGSHSTGSSARQTWTLPSEDPACPS